MSSYKFNSILLNGRSVTIEDILSHNLPAQTEFEKDTLLFLHHWLKGTDGFIIQTSGSTGKPKNIEITREQMEGSARMTIQALGLHPNDTAFVCLPTKYIAGKMMLVRALTGNMKIVAVEPVSNPLEQLGAAIPVDFAAFVPMQLHTMLSDGFAPQLNAMKYILVGGAAIAPTLRHKIVTSLHTNVYATYGMTETITHIGLQNLHKESHGRFQTLPGINLDIDSRGCLVIKAPYLKEPVITNDLAELNSPHTFTWLGRIDSVINSGGIKIIPEQVEAAVDEALRNFHLSRRFFVSGLPDERLGEKAVLFIEGDEVASETEHGIISFLKEHLPPYSQPQKIMYVPKFVETDTGKIKPKETLKALQKGK